MARNLPREIADKVAQAIGRKDRSLRSTALAAGIPATTFGRKIKGETDFTTPELFRIASYLGVTLLDFIPDPELEQLKVSA